jgi:glycosyltransferase involved in cell wall biosynthesis
MDCMKIAYVLPMTWACGGILAPLSQVNNLAARGHSVDVFAPEESSVDWFPLAVPLQHPRPAPIPEPYDAVVYVGDTFVKQSFRSAKQKYLLLQGKDHLWLAHTQRRQLLQAYADPQYHILAVSNWLAEFVSEQCGAEQVTVIPNGLDANRFFPVTTPPRTKLRFLLEGNFPDRNKNVIAAIEVAGRVRQRFSVEVWAMARRFVSAGELVDKVILDPPSDAIPGIYQQCDALIKTSFMEGFGLPHLEAMACGCVPITYASGGVLDFCRHGENSLVAGVGNLPALVSHALRFLGDPELRSRLKAGALETASFYSWPKVADRLESVLAGNAGEKI